VFGHKHEHEQEWTPVAGTVVESRQHHHDWTYVVDYRAPAGHTVRATVKALPHRNVELAPGTAVGLEVAATTQEVRFGAGQPAAGAPSVRDAIHLAKEMRSPGDGSAAMAAALAGLAQAAAQPGGPEIHVTSTTEVHVAGGSEVRVVGGAQAAEVMEAVQALMSGGDHAAAREKLRQLRADMVAQAGGPAPAAPAAGNPTTGGPAEPEGFSSGGPGTFDSVTPAPAVTPVPPPTTFSSPAATVGQPGNFSPVVAPATTFSSPVSPGSFEAGSFEAGSFAAGSFDASPAGSGSFGAFGASKSDRIARLEDQRDRGQLTPQQFEAQRQQILDEI
jgi:hypothetical protein